METFYQEIGKSRQDYAQSSHRKSKSELVEDQIIEAVHKWRELHPKMGSRPMYYSMLNDGIEIPMGVNKFEKIISAKGLTIGKVQRTGPYTSDGKGKDNYKNLTNGLVLKGINQLIVADITYFWLIDSWHYLFTLKDVYSQRILGLRPSKSMSVQTALDCLSDLEKCRGTTTLPGCIHHTDNGSQYNANVYKERLFKLDIQISRAEGCQQNGSSEQLNHIAKNMYLNNWAIGSERELIEACEEFKYLNNEKRSIAQLDYKTPSQFERHVAALTKEDRPVKTMHDFNQA
jgi:transposase InsO family protein